ncbi:MAG: response regulator [Anaerolineae bacterium]
MRLLLVEDEDGIGKFISQGLREAGHRVDWAQDGEKGLEYALDAEYDVMVLDIMLPKMDGLQLLQQLRKRR